MSNRSEETAAVWEDIDLLLPWGQNPRHNKSAIQSVADSIKRFGFGAPIVAREADKMVIAGHTRLEAAKLLGLDRVPVRYLDLDPADAKMLALADNKIGEIADWNDENLQSVLMELKDHDHDLSGLGWSPHEINEILNESLSEVNDPYEEYVDMPEYENSDLSSYKKLIVHFANEQDFDNFRSLIDQERITKKTRFIWYPGQEQWDNNEDTY